MTTQPPQSDHTHAPTPAPEAPKRKSAVGWAIHIAISGILIAVIIGVTWYIFHKPEGAITAFSAPPPPSAPLPVATVTVEPATVPITLDYLGQTEAFQRVEIRARVAAYLQERTFQEGSTVNQGQVLFKLERDTFEADVAAAKAAMQQSQATVEQAKRQVARFQDLVKDESATLRELEDWQTSLAVAQATALEAKARLQQAELSLGYTNVKSPLTGRVGKSNKDIGSYINPQTDSLLTVVEQIDPLYIQAPLTERDLLRWSKLIEADRSAEQIKVEVTLQDGSVYPYLGTVAFIDVRIQPRTGTAIVRAKLPNPQGLLIPGQLLRVKVLGLERKGTITVPQQAVIQSPGGAMVYTISDAGKATSTPVVLGDWLKDKWIIESGLKPGSKVITDHLMAIRPGSAVISEAEHQANLRAIAATQPATTQPAK
jgi:membrane fusion protein, multidrug efflux system